MIVLFNHGHAHGGGLVRARAKGHAGIQLDHQIAGLLIPGFPTGLDHQVLAGAEGLVILLPALSPILLVHARLGDFERAQIHARQLRQRVQAIFQPAQLLHGGKPGLYLHILGHFIQHFAVDQLPIAVGLIGIGHVAAVNNLRAYRALAHQRLRNNIRTLGVGGNGNFDPIHKKENSFDFPMCKSRKPRHSHHTVSGGICQYFSRRAEAPA